MTPARRLAVAGSASAAGALIGLAGASITWWTVTGPGKSVEAPGFGRAVFLRQEVPVSGSDVSGGLPILFLLAVIAAALAFLAGPRARAVLLASVPLLAAIACVLAVSVSSSDARAAARADGFTGAVAGIDDNSLPGKAITVAGVLVAAVGALIALPVARTVARVRMPETGPAESAQDLRD